MVQWNSPAELEEDSQAVNRLMWCIMGLYLWEWATSLDFDIRLLTSKRRIGRPLSVYLTGRYLLLLAIVGIVLSQNFKTKMNCQVVCTINQVLGNSAIGLASLNLALRTMAIWEWGRRISIPIGILIMGHWFILLHGVLITAEWTPGAGCAIVKTQNKILAAGCLYTMLLDAVVLGFTLIRIRPGDERPLAKLIVSDGLAYFAVAFLANALASGFMLANLNAVMSIAFKAPSAVCSTIVASHAVRRLYTSRREREEGNFETP